MRDHEISWVRKTQKNHPKLIGETSLCVSTVYNLSMSFDAILAEVEFDAHLE